MLGPTGASCFLPACKVELGSRGDWHLPVGRWVLWVTDPGGGEWGALVERGCVELNLNGSQLTSIRKGGFLRSWEASVCNRLGTGVEGGKRCFEPLWCCEEGEPGLERWSRNKGYSPAGHVYFGTCLSHMIMANTRKLFLRGHLITTQFVFYFSHCP